MLRIDILTVVPQIFESFFGHSMLKIAQEKKLATLQVHDIRDWSQDKHRRVDDYQFGGGAGMVLQIQPIADAITELDEKHQYDEIIYLTPDGKVLNQSTANALSLKGNLLLLCGHYKGIDERIRERFVTKEISIGDYVLTGGELAAAILTDSIVRLLPGVLGDETSALSDSFQDGLLSPPVYTRPRSYDGMDVPEILLNGDFAAIDQWRHEQSLKRTQERRPDLLDD